MMSLTLLLFAAPPEPPPPTAKSVTARSVVETHLRDVLRQCKLLTTAPTEPATNDERKAVAEECRGFVLASKRRQCEDSKAQGARQLWEERVQATIDAEYLKAHNKPLVQLPTSSTTHNLATGIFQCAGVDQERTCKRVAGLPEPEDDLYFALRDNNDRGESFYETSIDCTRFISEALSVSGSAKYGSLVGFSASSALKNEANSRQGISVRGGTFVNMVASPLHASAREEKLATLTTIAQMYANGTLDSTKSYEMIDEWTGLELQRNTLYGWSDDRSAQADLSVDISLMQYAKISADGSVTRSRKAISGLRSTNITFYREGMVDPIAVPTPTEITKRWQSARHDPDPVNGAEWEVSEERSAMPVVHFGPIDDCANVEVKPSDALVTDKTIEFRKHHHSLPTQGKRCALQVELALRNGADPQADGIETWATFQAYVKGTSLGRTFTVRIRPQITMVPITRADAFPYDAASGWRISFKLRDQRPFEVREIVTDAISCKAGGKDLANELTVASLPGQGNRDEHEFVLKVAKSSRRFKELSCQLSTPMNIRRGNRVIRTTLWAKLNLPQDQSSDKVLVDTTLADLQSLIRPDARTKDGSDFATWLGKRKGADESSAELNEAIRKTLGITASAVESSPVLEIPREKLKTEE